MKLSPWKWLMRILVSLSIVVIIYDAFLRASYASHWSGMAIPYSMVSATVLSCSPG